MNRLRRLLKVALRSILKNRMRSVLTSLGVIIGVGSVIVMVGLGAGAQADVQAQIQSLGANMIMVFPAWGSFRGVSQGAEARPRLTLEDADKIREEATLLTGLSPVVRSGGQVIGGVGNWNTSVEGVTPDYLKIRNWKLASGEFFTDRDVRAKSKVAVLGKTVVDNLFPNSDPVGEKIRIRNTPFKVIGVLQSRGESAFGQDQDDMILAPSRTVLSRLSGEDHIDRIYASVARPEDTDAAIAEITSILRAAHKLEPQEEDDFRVRNQAELMETATETQRVMTMFLGGVAAVSLIVGGIGIMNIMLVSVTERTREIGIRLAVGARSSDVMTQFLTESVMLSLFGGTIGVILAYTVAALMNHSGMTTVVKPVVVLLAFGFAGAVGVFFGYYPARKAAMLNPIDALRYE
ncbi:MAG: ABC transporter permease [Candidatus Eisenbacteria bacterium]|nr:ABC transporter permease [Candidatus Eisenbacteria bacterium]